MSELTDIYSEAWFKVREHYRFTYRAFAAAIEDLFHPRSLLDLGCGAGYILDGFEGRIPVLGIDGSAAAIAGQVSAGRLLLLRDLRRPPDMVDEAQIASYEFAVSIEVAEHIPPECTEGFMDWFRFAERVLFTAAPPGQGGNHHVNCQPKGYWIEQFRGLGFMHDGPLIAAYQTAARKRTRGCPWAVRNAMFFRRADE
jgi:SAM-dependent methyltransferase